MTDFVVIPGFPSYRINREGMVINQNNEEKIWHGNKYNQCSMYDIESKQMKTVLQHRLLAQTFLPNPNNLVDVDHINRNKRDNRLENLRWVSKADNEKNKGLTSRNTSGEKYISWCKAKQRWQVQIIYEAKCIRRYLRTIEEAICVRDEILLSISN
jgi:hypothetical protein